jgi:hypothetical protein
MLIVLLVTVLLLFLGDRYGVAAWRRTQLLYWQRQCMRYSPPPDRVVLDSADGGTTVYTPPCWNNFRRAAGLRPASSPLLFIGERRMKDGTPVLVVVDTNLLPPRVRLVTPASLFRPPRVKEPTQVSVGFGWVAGETGGKRRLPGRPHPTDPSRFLLPLDRLGAGAVLEGCLDDEGSFVRFRFVGVEGTDTLQ